MFYIKKSHQHSKGFTLIEMLIIAPVVILVIGGFVALVISLTGSVIASRGSSVLAYNIQDALNRIEQDVKSSGAILSTTNIAIQAPQGYNDDTSAFKYNTNGNSLILNEYATTVNPLNANSTTTVTNIYAHDRPNACGSSLVSQNVLLYINVVYFVKANSSGSLSLWRRTIVPANYTNLGCSTPWQQPSCSPAYIKTNGYSGICETNDTDLVDGINTSGGFSINYYSSAGSTSPTSISNSNTVGITITATQIVGGRTISQTGTLRVTGINNDPTAT